MSILASDACGGIVIEDGTIIELIKKGQAPVSYVDKIFNAKEHVVIPGLINTHHHFYQTLTRACPSALNKELFPWLTALYPIWERLNQTNFRLAVKVAMSELLLSGCTTMSDHHYVFPKGLKDAIDIQVDEAKKLGVRSHFTRGSMNLSKKDGGLPPNSVVQNIDEILKDSERVVKKYHDTKEGSMTQIALAPCSPFSVTTDIMKETAALADALDVRLHTHLAETQDENDFCIKMFGVRPLEYLDKVGWLNSRTWLAHGIHFSCDEMDSLAKNNVGISHCPSSNHLLASGHCQVKELESRGVTIGLGVDGSASSDSSNLMQEVRQAFFLQRMHYGASNVTHLDALSWATGGSAKLLGRDDIGKIQVGMQADLAMYKMDELRFSGAGDPLAALVLCGAHRADRVMIQGRWKIIDASIVGLDVEKLRKDHHKEAIKLMSQ